MTLAHAPLHDELWWPLAKYGVSYTPLMCTLHLVYGRPMW